MMKGASKYLVVLIFLVLATLVLGQRLTGLMKASPTQTIVDQCNSPEVENQSECFAKEIRVTIEQNPSQIREIFSELWRLSLAGKIDADPRIFSDPAHDAGRMLARKKIPIQQAFLWCGTDFKQGCIHGFIMEHIDRQYPGEISLIEMKGTCEQFSDTLSQENCIHGVGHGLAAKLSKDLRSILDLCKIFAHSPFSRSACESGVFMEYSKGGVGHGAHSHAHVGARRLPCGDLPDEYKSTCYGSEASYRQYGPDHESFADTYRYCASLPKTYTLQCFLGVSERALIAHAGNLERTTKLCEELPDAEVENCLTSIDQVRAFAIGWGEREK